MSRQKGKWHPLIIRWCFQLHSTSPKAYQMLKDSGVLELPDKRTLRDYSGCFKAGIGIDSNFLDLLKKIFLLEVMPKIVMDVLELYMMKFL